MTSIPKMSFRVCACVCRRETEFLAVAHHENMESELSRNWGMGGLNHAAEKSIWTGESPVETLVHQW